MILEMIEEPPPSQSTASVLLLCGLPASGKSSFARKIIDLHKQRHCKQTNDQVHDGNEFASTNKSSFQLSCGVPVLSRYDNVFLIDYDSITQQELTSCKGTSHENTSFDSNDLNAWRKTRVKALDTLKGTLITHFADDTGASSILVIMDDNFHLRSMRRDVYRSCQEILPLPSTSNHSQTKIVGFSTLYFSTPLDLCLQRNNLRVGKERIPIDVINRMALVMEPPDESKPYASFERFHATIENSDDSIDTDKSRESSEVLRGIDQCLHQALQSPIPPKDELSQQEIAQLEQQRIRQRGETLKCQTQRIDQLLRKLVGAVGRADKKRSREANEIRKSIMETVRQHDNEDGLSDDYVIRHFACSILGIEINTDWCDMENPLVKSIKNAFDEFQADRKS